MFRATGAGKTETDSKYSSHGMLKALLYNFDFDDMASSVLKPEHKVFLSDKALPLLASDRGHIWMQGSASLVGANDYNKTLSRARVKRVAEFLKAAGISDKQMQLDAVGEDLSIGHKSDDERDRAVAFVILPHAKVDPPPPPKPPAKPKITQNFKISMLAGVAGLKAVKWAKLLKGKPAAGVAADVLFFQIWDTENDTASIYVYIGAGIGAGIPQLPSLSATTHGPWNKFTTSAPISSAQFGGFTRFTTAGVGPYTKNILNMVGTPSGVDAVYMEINTGTTIGLGATSTVGDMTLLEGPDPFSGP